MDTNSDNSVFILDLKNLESESEVSLTGKVTSRKQFSDKTKSFVLKDITDKIRVNIFEDDPTYKEWEKIKVNRIIKIKGRKILNSKGVLVFTKTTSIEVKPQLFAEDVKKGFSNDYASKILNARLIKLVSDFLDTEKFTNLETKLISNKVITDSLEPLTVNYPGFGSSAYLMVSPATQILQFLIDSLAQSAYSISKSFSTSYRFPNGSTEMNVIVAKTIQFDESELKLFITKLIKRIISSFKITSLNIIVDNQKWGSFSKPTLIQDNQVGVIDFECNFSIVSENWESEVTNLINCIGSNDLLFIEGVIENIKGAKTKISTITIYPDQILALIRKSPRRQLQNLIKVYG